MGDLRYPLGGGIGLATWTWRPQSLPGCGDDAKVIFMLASLGLADGRYSRVTGFPIHPSPPKSSDLQPQSMEYGSAASVDASQEVPTTSVSALLCSRQGEYHQLHYPPAASTHSVARPPPERTGSASLQRIASFRLSIILLPRFLAAF